MKKLQNALRLHAIDLANSISPDYGQREYKRFILLGRSRVGSNMLRSILNTHESLFCFGELFRHKGEVGWDTSYYRHRRLDPFGEGKMLQERPVDFLEQKVFQRYPEKVKAVGFKIFYYHAQEDPWKDIWKYVKANNFHILHLKRRNLLRVFLSKQLAETSGNWKGKSYGDVQLHLDPETCEKDFLKTEQWWETYNAYFSPNPCLEVWYEELTANLASETRRIFDFLGVEAGSRPIQPATPKQRKSSLRQQIENYDELKRHFAGTRWEKFFV